MHPLSSGLLCFGLVTLVACATTPRPEPGPGAPEISSVPTGRALDDAIASAKLRFNTAARAGDVAAMSESFDQGAIVITPDREMIRGRAAIAERIARLAPAGGAVAQLLPRRVEACADGASEFGGDWVLRPLAASGPELARGGYAVRWQHDPVAGMRVGVLVLHGTSAAERARGQREVRCVAPHVRAFARRRFEISISPPHAGVWQSRAGESIADAMRGQGFTTQALRTSDGQSIQPGLDEEEAESSGALALRWQARPSLVVELFAPFSALESVVRGYDESASANVVVLHSGRMAGAIVSYEWRRLRVGAGPVFMRSTWHEREERLVTTRNAQGEFGSFVSEGFPNDEQYTTNTVSALAEIGYTYPIAPRMFMDARVHYRALASHTTRGTTSLGPIDVDLGGLTAAIGFGIAF